jgi:molecular chaperone DnaK (HSP70)
MKAIGLDFGTTNSTISFFRETKGIQLIEGFEPFNGRSEYIPSVVAYRDSDEFLVGFGAAEELTSGNFDTYENFKIHLAKDSIPNRDRKAIHVFGDYIKGLLGLYKSSTGHWPKSTTPTAEEMPTP